MLLSFIIILAFLYRSFYSHTALDHGRTGCCECAWDLGRGMLIPTHFLRILLMCAGMLVHPTHTSNRYQLPSTQCHWTTANDDDAVGLGRGAFRSLQYCRGI